MMKMKTPQFGLLEPLHATVGEARQVFRAALEEEEVRGSTIIILEELQDISRIVLICPGCRKLADSQGVDLDFRHNPMKCPSKIILRSIQEGLKEEEESLEEFGNTDNSILQIPA